MKAKTLISIIAFVTTFSISVAIASIWKIGTSTCLLGLKDKKVDKETAERITALLEEDIANGRLRDFQIKELLSNEKLESSDYKTQKAMLTRQYWEASNSIKTEDLPDDFVKAWKMHMRAWEKYADFLESSTESKYERCKERKYHKEISDTWMEVLRVAKEQYGAEIPEGAY